MPRRTPGVRNRGLRAGTGFVRACWSAILVMIVHLFVTTRQGPKRDEKRSAHGVSSLDTIMDTFSDMITAGPGSSRTEEPPSPHVNDDIDPTTSRSVAERRSPPPSCMIVYHTPKTGGTTMEVYLEMLADALGWTLHEWDSFARSMPGADPYLPRLLSFRRGIIHEGHLTPRFEEVTDTASCAKITVLREPVSRVVSAFHFHRRDRRKFTQNDVSEDALRDCLRKSCDLNFEYMNDVVRRFAGKNPGWNSFDEEKYVVGGRPPNDLNEKDLEAARQRLLSFDAVCILPDVKRCFGEYIRDTFRVNLTLPSVKKNRGHYGRIAISDNLQREIARANSLDVKLFAWAVKIFNHTHTAAHSGKGTDWDR